MSRTIQTAQTVMAGQSGGEKAGDILFDVLLDRLWKMGIVVAAAILVLTAMIIIYRRTGTK
ncbi:hypothetical protein OG735_31780 [Streptomyces sp. NBC_01210]|uniref:hypothetical protein n=1 Tax=Streptomyces sp. NBC_01210 TaxID=2903774 RepID=UPI002E107441|nr:hypothetical protein OG735_31780 [Streptomyces sp. NBC_01210]